MGVVIVLSAEVDRPRCDPSLLASSINRGVDCLEENQPPKSKRRSQGAQGLLGLQPENNMPPHSFAWPWQPRGP